MGLSNKKTTSAQTTSQTTNQTQTPNNPAWVTDALQGYTGRVNSLAGTDPYSYVAPATGLQNQAFQGAAGLDGGADTFGRAKGLIRDDYSTPYTDQVVRTSLDDFDANAGQVRAGQAAGAARNGAFGGSRYGIREAQTEGELGRARGALESGLLNQGYQQTIANEQAGAGLLGGLASSEGAAQRADLATQAGLGEMQRGIQQEGLQAPFDFERSIADLLSRGQFGLFQGQTSTGQANGQSQGTNVEHSSTASDIGNIAKIAAGLFSDARLKRDIRRVGSLKGHNLYAYKYLWSDEDEVGVIAQEVIGTGAVSIGPGGFLMVDYGGL